MAKTAASWFLPRQFLTGLNSTVWLGLKDFRLWKILTLIRLTFESLARTGWWWLSPPPEKSVITQLILLIFGHKIPQMKIYIVLNPQCIAAVLPDPFSLSKRGQKYLKIAKSHYFIYFLMINKKSMNCSILWLYRHKK